jgi:hypothetical protein
LPVGSEVHAGSLLARIRDSGNTQEFRAAVDGKITTLIVAKEVEYDCPNQTIAWLAPDRATILAALRALAYVGTADDLLLVKSVTQIDASRETVNQASLTAKSIRSRTRAIDQRKAQRPKTKGLRPS